MCSMPDFRDSLLTNGVLAVILGRVRVTKAIVSA